MSRLAYLLAHGVKEGLVASPYDWPGVHCARALVEGKPVSGRWRRPDARIQSAAQGPPSGSGSLRRARAAHARSAALLADAGACGLSRSNPGDDRGDRDRRAAAPGGDRKAAARSRSDLPPGPASRAQPDQEGAGTARSCRGAGGASSPSAGLLQFSRRLPASRPPAPRRSEGSRVPRRSLPPSPSGAIRRPKRLGLARKPARAPGPDANSVASVAAGSPEIRSFAAQRRPSRRAAQTSRPIQRPFPPLPLGRKRLAPPAASSADASACTSPLPTTTTSSGPGWQPFRPLECLAPPGDVTGDFLGTLPGQGPALPGRRPSRRKRWHPCRRPCRQARRRRGLPGEVGF